MLQFWSNIVPRLLQLGKFIFYIYLNNTIISHLNIVILNPIEGVVELRINALQVLHGEFLAQHPLIEGHCEARVDELAVVEGHGNEATDELKVGQVVGVHLRGRVDLQRVVALVGVLKEAVHWVQHLVTQLEEPFSVINKIISKHTH